MRIKQNHRQRYDKLKAFHDSRPNAGVKRYRTRFMTRFATKLTKSSVKNAETPARVQGLQNVDIKKEVAAH